MPPISSVTSSAIVLRNISIFWSCVNVYKSNSLLACSLLVALYGHASVLQFPGSHSLTLVVICEMSTETRRGKRTIFLKQAGSSTIQNRTTTIGHWCFLFFLNLLYYKLTQSALRLLFWVMSRTRKHTSFTRRGSHCRCVHALLTLFTLHMCACLSTRAQLLCMFIYVTESGHNLGRTNNYFIIVI